MARGRPSSTPPLDDRLETESGRAKGSDRDERPALRIRRQTETCIGNWRGRAVAAEQAARIVVARTGGSRSGFAAARAVAKMAVSARRSRRRHCHCPADLVSVPGRLRGEEQWLRRSSTGAQRRQRPAAGDRDLAATRGSIQERRARRPRTGAGRRALRRPRSRAGRYARRRGEAGAARHGCQGRRAPRDPDSSRRASRAGRRGAGSRGQMRSRHP
jgi:hypothetical protein